MRAWIMTAVIMELAWFSLSCSPRRYFNPADRAPPELTFWQVCYLPNGEVDNYDGTCERPSEVTWSFPISVYIPPTYTDEIKHTALTALAVWNTWLGTEVFVPTDEARTPDVWFMNGGHSSWGLAGIAMHKLRVYRRRRPQFHVVLYGNYVTNVVTAVHEFGHVLGLTHDTGRTRSVMFPHTESTLPWLSDVDCTALERKYASAGVKCAN